MILRRMLLPALLLAASVVPAAGGDVIAPINKRFQVADTKEVPDFRSHLIPMMGKLGCNGRACHGSFQGRGGFRLSLFGYDFKADHDQMTKGEKPRVNTAKPEESLVIRKPSSDLIHEGGQRYKKGSWEHHVFKRWIEGGAKGVDSKHADFQGLDITPRELLFSGKGQKTQLKVVAKWSDGSREDVTPICRFQSNDTQVCKIDDNGLVTSGEPGDTHVVVFYDAGVVPVPVIRPVSDKVGSRYPRVPTPTTVDKLVVQKLRKLGIVPSELAGDAEFLRRVSLDLTGTLPSAKEVQAFLADKSADKRRKKIDELLKSPAYVAWWTTKLCDFTGNNDDGLVNVSPARGSASTDWYKWIYKRVENNTPYDKIVENIVLAVSRNKGESYEEFCKSMSETYHPDATKSFADRDYMPYYWARRTFRQPTDRAIGFAYTFLGMRIQCAQCHKHPFDRWTKDDFAQFTGFFRSTQAGIRDRAEYQNMLKKLGVEGRGNQIRNQLGRMLQQGKVIPFQEVYARPDQPRRRRNNNRNVLPNLRRQLRELQQKVAQLRKDGKTKEAQEVQRQVVQQQRRIQRLQNAGNIGGGDAKLLGAEKVDLSKVADSREPLMKWLRDPSHAMLSRAFVNRVWASYFNIGIVNPPDDLSLANPPSNKELLDHLTTGFIKSGYDMKWLHREILASRTYQLSWRPNATNKQDERNFSRAVPRRLPAEVVYDALQQATASDEKHAAARTDINGRAISIPGAGRRNRNARGAQYALDIFGRSIRSSNCDCDRSQEPSLLQTVYLQNDRDMYVMMTRPREGWLRELATELNVRPPTAVAPQNNGRRGRGPGNARQVRLLRTNIANLTERLAAARKAEQPQQVQQLTRQLRQARNRLAQLTGNRGNAPQSNSSGGEKLAKVDAESIVQRAYLRTLSRYPSESELKKASAYIREADTTINGVRDVLWALLNTKEFIVNH